MGNLSEQSSTGVFNTNEKGNKSNQSMVLDQNNNLLVSFSNKNRN